MPDPMPFQPLDHAAAHERLADLGLEPEALPALEASPLPADRALFEHVRGCATCQAEVAATARLRDALQGAFAAMPDLPTLDPILPPQALRAEVLRAARADKVAAAASASEAASTTVPRINLAVTPPRRSWLPAWSAPRWAAAVAAVLLVALLGTAAGLQLGRRSAEDDIASLNSLVATVDRVLSTNPHWVAGLTTPSGAPGGTVAWTKQDFAVVTTALARPPTGQVYRCWLAWQGRTAAIGQMEFNGPTAYWTGSVGTWATLDVSPGTRFFVTLESSPSPPASSGPSTAPVLQADLTE